MIAFVLGLIIGYLISWFFRDKQPVVIPQAGVDASAAADGAAEPALAEPQEARPMTPPTADSGTEVDAAPPVSEAGAGEPALTMIGEQEPPSPGDDADAGGAEAPAATADTAPAEAAPEESPYGPGSALALAGGAAPSAEYTVKGNAGSKLYHTPESPYYGRTKAEVWFKTPEDAQRAGFSRRNRTKTKPKPATDEAESGPIGGGTVLGAGRAPAADAQPEPADTAPAEPDAPADDEADTGRIPVQAPEDDGSTTGNERS